MPDPNIPHAIEAKIDAALDSYPVYDVPQGFSSRVMLLVRAQAAPETHEAAFPAATASPQTMSQNPGGDAQKVLPSPAFRFHFDFLDLALPLFFATFGAVVLGMIAFFISQMNQYQRMKLALDFQASLARVTSVPGIAIATVILGAILLALLTLLVALIVLPKRSTYVNA